MQSVPLKNSPVDLLALKAGVGKGKSAKMVDPSSVGGNEFENLLKMIESNSANKGVDLTSLFSKSENQFLTEGTLPEMAPLDTLPVQSDAELMSLIDESQMVTDEVVPQEIMQQNLQGGVPRELVATDKTKNLWQPEEVNARAVVQNVSEKESVAVESPKKTSEARSIFTSIPKNEVLMNEEKRAEVLPEKNIEQRTFFKSSPQVSAKAYAKQAGDQGGLVAQESEVKAPTPDQIPIEFRRSEVKLAEKANTNSGQVSEAEVFKMPTPRAQQAHNVVNQYQSNTNESKLIRKTPESVKVTEKRRDMTDQLSSQVASLLENSKPAIATGAIVQTNSPTPVLDLRGQKVNTNIELMNQISNYLEQNQVASQKDVEVLVRHDTLGDFTVKAHRTSSQGQGVEIEIFSKSDRANEFFARNEVNLQRTLENSGVTVTDIKIGMNSETRTNDSGQRDMNFNDHRGQSQYRGSERGDTTRDEDSRRRQELWQMYRERGVA